MLKKLRNKFLILNISIITFVTLVAFAVIYLTTYNNIQSENEEKLKAGIQALQVKQAQQVKQEQMESPESDQQIDSEEPLIGQKTSSGDLRFINILVDKNGTVVSTDSFYDLAEETYQKLAELAWKQKTNYSVISVDGKEWKYVIEPAYEIRAVYENGQAQIATNATGNDNIIFLDVTDSSKTLLSLFYTFLIVALIMLFVIIAISFYFANNAIKPIAGAWEKQKQFVVDASHELKTPLTIIKSNYGVLMSSKEETIESQMKWFEYIDVGTNRMSKLINDLLTLAAIDDMNSKIQSATFDMSDTVKDVIMSMEAGAVAKGICLSSSIDPHIMINSDSEEMAQIVTILLDNAIKYTESSGRIDVIVTKSKNHVTCCVKNTGMGINEEDLSKIFDRFYRPDSSRGSDSGGYGLGLSIAKATAHKLGGKLSVKSTINESTTFTLTLKL